MMRVLLVEDDARIARFVAKGLREQSYAVDLTTNGADALYQAEINNYDVFILDVMIPAPDGFAVCRQLRQADIRAPILMLTARDAVLHRKVVAFDREAIVAVLERIALAAFVGAQHHRIVARSDLVVTACPFFEDQHRTR